MLIKKFHYQRNDNGLCVGRCVHQSHDGLGPHPAAEDPVEGRRGAASLNVTENCDSGVLLQFVHTDFLNLQKVNFSIYFLNLKKSASTIYFCICKYQCIPIYREVVSQQ